MHYRRPFSRGEVEAVGLATAFLLGVAFPLWAAYFGWLLPLLVAAPLLTAAAIYRPARRWLVNADWYAAGSLVLFCLFVLPFVAGLVYWLVSGVLLPDSPGMIPYWLLVGLVLGPAIYCDCSRWLASVTPRRE